MKFFKILCLLFYSNIFRFYCQNQSDIQNINNENISIQNAIYIIRNREGNKNLEFGNNGYPIFLNDEKKPLKRNYLITKYNKISNINITNNYFYIIDNYVGKKIGITEQEKIAPLSNDLTNKENDLLWNIIPKIISDNILVYYIQNKKNKKFWKYSPIDSNQLSLSQVTDINNLTIYNEFQLIKMYQVSDKKETNLLKEEPIDVLIKYIDLSDPNLVRKGIPQIKKDFDNKELKFSVRSILQNIPWIRKIFILMPNEKVSYFKSQKEINEKIIYVKDKDFLGFDSASSPSFQFNLHKMKKFGISENFILMDDDCFIAKPLKKSDFFYEENGKIFPALITSDYYEMNKTLLKKQLDTYLSKKDVKLAHSTTGFHIQHLRSLLLMYDIFGDDNKRYGKKLIEPAYTHNAIPVKLSDIQEIYNYIIKYYPFANNTLFALFRSVYSLQMQTTYMAYVKNQYNRKVSIISSEFYDLSYFRYIPQNKKELFVINTGSLKYKKHVYTYERKVLSNLFPYKTQYELDNGIDIELKDLIDLENSIYKYIYSEISKYSKNKIIEINKNINKSSKSIINKINQVNELINELKVNNEKNYNKIIRDEINYINFQNNKLSIIYYFFLLFIIFLICVKAFRKLIRIKNNNEKLKRMVIII